MKKMAWHRLAARPFVEAMPGGIRGTNYPIVSSISE